MVGNTLIHFSIVGRSLQITYKPRRDRIIVTAFQMDTIGGVLMDSKNNSKRRLLRIRDKQGKCLFSSEEPIPATDPTLEQLYETLKTLLERE